MLTCLTHLATGDDTQELPTIRPSHNATLGALGIHYSSFSVLWLSIQDLKPTASNLKIWNWVKRGKKGLLLSYLSPFT